MSNQKEYLRNRANSKISKIVIDRDLCIGAATCIAVTPESFKLDEESKAIVIDPDAVDDDILISAVNSCPTKAILLFDKDGKQIQ